MDGYRIVIASRPSHACELRLNAYLISPIGTQVVLRGHNHLHSESETKLRNILKKHWPGFPITRDDDLYVVGVDPVPATINRRIS